MRILLAGRHTALANAPYPILTSFSKVLTAGRREGDRHTNHAQQAESFQPSLGIDVAIDTAADFGGSNFDNLCAAENINVVIGLYLSKGTEPNDYSQRILAKIAGGLDTRTNGPRGFRSSATVLFKDCIKRNAVIPPCVALDA